MIQLTLDGEAIGAAVATTVFNLVSSILSGGHGGRKDVAQKEVTFGHGLPDLLPLPTAMIGRVFALECRNVEEHLERESERELHIQSAKQK